MTVGVTVGDVENKLKIARSRFSGRKKTLGEEGTVAASMALLCQHVACCVCVIPGQGQGSGERAQRGMTGNGVAEATWRGEEMGVM